MRRWGRAWRAVARKSRPALLLALVAICFPATVWADRNQATKAGSRVGMTTAKVAFEPVAFDRLPHWTQDDHGAALRAFLTSCDRVLSAVRAGSATGSVPTSPELLSACYDAAQLLGRRPTREAARQFFERHFAPHRVVHDRPEGLLTGYYEPLLKGSRTRTAAFTVPVLKRPPELENLIGDAMRGASGTALTHARRTEKGLVPFATREEIDKGALAGRDLELIWLADAVELFFLQVQGSGRVKLTDGTSIRITYDGKNGHPYTSIGRYLIDNALLPADRMSLEALGKWLKADPERGRKVMWQNKSYVFFRELKGDAKTALGVHSIPLTPGRSLAVDAGVHALGLPIFVSAPTLDHVLSPGGFHRLMFAHDVGSAIRGPERGDIYFGSGVAAGKLAGITKHPGNLFVLLPRPVTASIPTRKVLAHLWRARGMVGDGHARTIRQAWPAGEPMTRRKSHGARPPGHLSVEDAALWHAVAGDIEPVLRSKPRVLDRADPEAQLPDQGEASPSTRTAAKTQRASAQTAPPRRPAHQKHRANAGQGGPPQGRPPPQPPPAAPPLAGFDRKKAKRIAAGRESIDARIDLHGMRQTEAHAALRRFLLAAHAAGRRTVLVITGKGGPARADDDAPRDFLVAHERGVLKRNVPRWLAEPELRAIVVSYRPAAIQHGGEGAIYVHLRTARKVRS